ncbi:cryptochrome-interacting basic-helix-loop-helix5 [Striga asiatica]|uniref:Cryptochrome-interacting basic-helix-loop-helix5 n=1 Tax=Striga asiatica TaxID=4170 RepID=A0A5A7RE93_STRAF|nr:cryptochrome-interacting basic-helix-loop-helix5 [Striga asiatica]
MCILCVIQKWSRRIATMLPWLVIPLIALWALSQLLPPAFRFEITSPRLACVLVLLVTLFWYEVLMPQLSAWRIRRNARLRERKRFEAIELQKLRKTATRRCRNCLTAYRDQNPGGGKFMCSYCGHISKRPVLDLPVPPGMGNSGILKDLVGKGGKILNGKAWSDNGWMCGQDWLENGNWAGGPFAGKSSYGKRSGGGLFRGDDSHCLAEKSYSRVFIFACRALTAVFLCVVWVWRKIFRVSSSRDDALADAARRGMLDNRGENGGSGQESRGEKARRKAEEKRQARLEKELLEEEERKQREEVARLVEERRRLRDEKMEAEKDYGKGGSPRAKARDSKKEAERKRQERKKERDKGSSKSNSDAEELERRAGNQNIKNERGQHTSTPDSVRTHGTEMGHGYKGAGAGIHGRGNAGTRYFDRMRGTFLSSSRAFTGGGFFGKSTNTSTISRDHKTSGLVGTVQSSTYRKEIPERVSGRSIGNGDDKSANRPILIESQPSTAPKKSWQQLFTRSSAGSPAPPSNPNVISRQTGNHKSEVQNQPVSCQLTSTQSFDNPINFGLANPFSLPSFPFVSTSSTSTIPPVSSGAMLPKTLDSPHQLLPEELEIFEDPCYVPDPISLLGPVSESLDNFQLDRGFATDPRFEKPGPVKTKAAPSVVTKPSPIESPLSRSRVSEEQHACSLLFPGSPKDQDNNSVNTNDNRTWQMWNSSPLGQDGLGIVGGPAIGWHLYPEMNLLKKDHIHPVPRKTMASLFKKDEKAIPNGHPSQNVLFGHAPNGGAFNTSLPPNVDDPWLPRTLFGHNIGPQNQILLKPKEDGLQNGLIYGNSSTPTANQQYDLSAVDSWHKKDWPVPGSRDGVGNSPVSRPHIGGLYTPPDVQSLW